MNYLLDTSVYSQPLKREPHDGVMNRLDRLSLRQLATSSVVVAETLAGIHMSGSRRLLHQYEVQLKGRISVLAFDEEVANTYAYLKAEMRGIGRPRPALDLMIAATARHHGLIVATLNEKDFLGIPGVAVENWA